MGILKTVFPNEQVEQKSPVQQMADSASSGGVEDRLYDAFASAETGSFVNPWIRTTSQPKGGSTAYGPTQITRTKASDYAGLNPKGRKKAVISPESVKFVKEVLIPMQDKMNKYGGKDMKPGFEAYDYGGSGEFDVENYGDAYKKLAKEMLMYDYNQAGGDIDKTIRLWRGVADDERYNKEVKSKFK